jgi:hypothetical protein
LKLSAPSFFECATINRLDTHIRLDLYQIFLGQLLRRAFSLAIVHGGCLLGWKSSKVRIEAAAADEGELFSVSEKAKVFKKLQ